MLFISSQEKQGSEGAGETISGQEGEGAEGGGFINGLQWGLVGWSWQGLYTG